MKKLLLTLLIVVASLTARAYDYPYLVFQTTSGAVYSMAVESLTITINGSELVATNSEETQTFALTELSKMFFSESTTGVEEVFNSDSGEVAVYAVTGAYIGNYSNASDAVKALQPGIYLLKTKSNTIKIAVR